MELKTKFFTILMAIGFLLPAFHSANAVNIEDLKVNGYIDLEYIEASKSNKESSTNGSFDIHHFNILFDFPVNDRLITKTQIEFEHGFDTEKNYGKLQIEYAFFEFKFLNGFNLRGGKILTPFGFLNEVRDTTPAYFSVHIPFNIYSAKKRGSDVDFFPEYNTGIGFLGLHSTDGLSSSNLEVEYDLFLGNGENLEGTNPNESDDNRNKALSGRVNFLLYDLLTLGVSFYTGDKAITEEIDETHNTIAATFIFDNEPVNLIIEGVYSKLGDSEYWAGYVQAAFALSIDLYPYYRYEYLDPLVTASDDNWQTHLLGVNYIVMESVVIKAEYDTHELGGKNSLLMNGHRRYNEIKTAIAISF